MKQISYVMVKPYFANSKAIIDEIKRRLQLSGMKIMDESYIRYDKKRASMHYSEHIGKSFYPELEDYLTSDKAYGMIVAGENAIQVIRELMGQTKNPKEGTVRYDIPKALGIAMRITENVVHSSDSEESAKKEIGIFLQLKKEYSNQQTNNTAKTNKTKTSGSNFNKCDDDFVL